jgi:putative intracellular protease/amidase
MPDGSFLVKDKRLTSFSSNEEVEYGINDVDFLLDITLSKRGANYSCAEKWKSHVVIDGNLVTGQNPASATDVAKEVVKLLKLEKTAL